MLHCPSGAEQQLRIGPQPSLPSCRLCPGSTALRPSVQAGGLRGQTAACPKTASLESVPVSSLHLPFAFLPSCQMDAVLCQTATTARLWSSRKEKGSWICCFLAAIGKTGKIRKTKCKWYCIHRLPIDRPSQEKGECANMLQLSGFPVKACSSPC